MGRADDKESDGLISEADEEQEKNTSDIDEPDYDATKQDGETFDMEDPDYDSRKKYKCTRPGCTARFLRPSRLTWHLRKHNDERPYKCDREGCERAYTNSSHLKRHQNSHTPVTKSYECTECSVIVGSLFSLKRHHRKIHDPTRLTCELCGAKFRKKHCYTEHLSMHAGVTLYDCDGCDQQFSTQRLLKKHQIIHEKLKSYACKSPGCTEIFNQWSKLVKHVETKHEFAHECSRCDKKFKNKSQLSLHETVHDNKFKTKQCPYENCPRFYTLEKNLEEHIATTHLGRRFNCDTCGQQLTSKASIIRHIKKIHEKSEYPLKRNRKQFRRRRKDAGKRKKSMATKLAGLELPHDLEKIVLMREPKIILERLAKSKMASRKDKEEESSTSLPTNEAEIIVKNYLEEFTGLPKQNEEEISLSASNLQHTERLQIFENLAEEFSDTIKQTNEQISTLGDEQMQNSSRIVEEKNLEKSSVVSGQTDEEIELLEVELEQTDDSNVFKTNLEEPPKLSRKIDTNISLSVEKILQDDTKVMLEKFSETSSIISGKIDEEIELLEVELEQSDNSNVSQNNLEELPKLPRKIDRDFSLLAEEIVQDDTEVMLEKHSKKSSVRQIDTNISPSAETMVQYNTKIMLEEFSGTSSIISGKIDEEIELLEFELGETNGSNVSESDFQESPKSPGEFDRGILFPAEEILQNDTILDNFLEKSSFTLPEVEKGVSILVVHRFEARKDPRRGAVWASKVAENRVEASKEPERMDVDVSSLGDNLLENDSRIVLKKSPIGSRKTNDEISMLEADRMHNHLAGNLQTRSDPRAKIVWDLKLVENPAKNHVEKLPHVPKQIEVDISLFPNNPLANDAGIILEKSSNVTKQSEDEILFRQTERLKVFDNYLQSPDLPSVVEKKSMTLVNRSPRELCCQLLDTL